MGMDSTGKRHGIGNSRAYISAAERIGSGDDHPGFGEMADGILSTCKSRLFEGFGVGFDPRVVEIFVDDEQDGDVSFGMFDFVGCKFDFHKMTLS